MSVNPMLAGRLDNINDLRFPVLASPKLDGIRIRVMDGKPMSRSMKLLPNLMLQRLIAYCADFIEGMDGEVIVGEPTDKDVYRNTVVEVNTIDRAFTGTIYFFDMWNRPGIPFRERLNSVAFVLRLHARHHSFKVVHHKLIKDMDALNAFEADMLAQGYEGIMTRDPEGFYKNGRSTAKEQGLIKVKRFEDDEAVIVGIEELMHNDNQAKVNELGRTSRSSHAENLVPAGTMGALIVEGVTGGAFAGVKFNIGTGFDAATRASFWQDNQIGKVVTYKHFPIGVKDKPRHPVFKAIRPEGT